MRKKRYIFSEEMAKKAENFYKKWIAGGRPANDIIEGIVQDICLELKKSGVRL